MIIETKKGRTEKIVGFYTGRLPFPGRLVNVQGDVVNQNDLKKTYLEVVRDDGHFPAVLVGFVDGRNIRVKYEDTTEDIINVSIVTISSLRNLQRTYPNIVGVV